MRQLCLLILFGAVAMGVCLTACDDGSSGSGDGDTDSDTDGDTDTDTDADTDTDTDSDTDSAVENVYIRPDEGSFDDVHGDATEQVVETDFDVSGVDFSLGGMNDDLPEPAINCLDDDITQECISVVGVFDDNTPFEVLCYGDVGGGSGRGGTAEVSRYGVWCGDLRASDEFTMEIFWPQWSEVPAILDEVTVGGSETPDIYMDVRLWRFDGPWVRTNETVLIKALVQGYAVHSEDFGDAEDVMAKISFAASWDDSAEHTQGLRLKGTAKGYFD